MTPSLLTEVWKGFDIMNERVQKITIMHSIATKICYFLFSKSINPFKGSYLTVELRNFNSNTNILILIKSNSLIKFYFYKYD